MTRARRGLLVCGHLPTLKGDKKCWAPWLEWAEKCGLVDGMPSKDQAAETALTKLGREPKENLLSGKTADGGMVGGAASVVNNLDTARIVVDDSEFLLEAEPEVQEGQPVKRTAADAALDTM